MATATFQQHLENLTRLEEKMETKISELGAQGDLPATREEIKDLTSSIQGLMEKARVVAEEQETEGEKVALLDKLARHEKEFERLRGGVRKATLQAKEAAAKRSAQERGDLLEGTAGATLRKRGAGGDGAGKALAASAAVTSSLQRLQQTMAAELQRTANTAQTLEASSSTLKSSAQEAAAVDSRLSKARSLLQRIARNNCTDMALMVFGLLVFGSVVLYILKRRVYDKVF